MVLLLTMGTLVGLAVLAVIDASRGTDDVEPRLVALYPNPFLTVVDAAGDIGSPSSGPFSPMKELFIESQVGPDVIVEGGAAFDPETGNPVELANEIGGFPLWARSLLVQAAIALVLAVVGVRRLRAPHRELQT
jgi:hypothetical protein